MITTDTIITEVANAFDVDHNEIRSGDAHYSVSLARSLAVYFCRTKLKKTAPQLVCVFDVSIPTISAATTRIKKAIKNKEKYVFEIYEKLVIRFDEINKKGR